MTTCKSPATFSRSAGWTPCTHPEPASCSIERPRNSSQGRLKKSNALSRFDRHTITGAVSAIRRNRSSLSRSAASTRRRLARWTSSMPISSVCSARTQAGADHVIPVLGPERWFLEQDDAAGRERALVNAPTGQLARVEGRDLGCAIGGNILRPGAAGDTQGDFRSLRGASHRIVDDAPDGSVTEERSPGTVDGDGGRARDSVQDNAWLLAHTGILMSCSCVEDDRSSREGPHGREQFIVAEVGQVGEFHPALELFELL